MLRKHKPGADKIVQWATVPPKKPTISPQDLQVESFGFHMALPTLRTTVVAGSPSRVALTGYGTVMVKGYQGPCRILTESRGCLGTVGTKQLMVIMWGVSIPSFPFLLVPPGSIFWGNTDH